MGSQGAGILATGSSIRSFGRTLRMTEIREKLIEILDRTAEKLRETNLPDTLAAEIERLAGQVNQRCVVAVVGQVKVGKSTFVNALLGQDLAKVGTTETTATINYFSNGKPP